MSDRKPQTHIVYNRVTTHEGRSIRTGVIKSSWYKACFSRKEVPTGEEGQVKKVRVPNDAYVSLKEFVKKSLRGENGEETKSAAETWSFNKRANTAKPPLGIGRTSKSKSTPKKS